MRILLWNCCNGFGDQSKIDYIKSFNPDIAVIPEIKQKNIDQIKPDDSEWITNNHKNPIPKGLGVLGFNGYKLTRLPRDEEMEIFIPLRVTKDSFAFNLLAVWNFYYASKQGRFKDLRGPECLEYSALRHYQPMFSDPSLIIGDWNLGPTFSQPSFLKIVDMASQSGMKSIYHEFFKLPHDQTNHSTFRQIRKGVPLLHHLDHIFGSKFFYENISDLLIDDFTNVVRSDHAPVVLDINTYEQLSPTTS